MSIDHYEPNRLLLAVREDYFSADSHYKESVMSTDILVNSDGNVTWVAAAIFKSSCPLDVRYYPFDRQVNICRSQDYF